jgi:uncharacterized protein YukE
MKFSVDTDDLRGISTAFDRASSEVTRVRAVLASQAAGPESKDVIGSAETATQYTRTLQSWLRNLDQLAASLDAMTRKMAAAADHYEATEQGNTIRADSPPEQ